VLTVSSLTFPTSLSASSAINRLSLRCGELYLCSSARVLSADPCHRWRQRARGQPRKPGRRQVCRSVCSCVHYTAIDHHLSLEISNSLNVRSIADKAMKGGDMHGEAPHFRGIERQVPVSSQVEYLIPNPLTQPHSHVYVILEVPVDLTRPQVVDHVKLVLADDEVVAQRARDALTCGSASILWVEDREERLSGKWLPLKLSYHICQITIAKPNSLVWLASISRELWPKPLHVVMVIDPLSLSLQRYSGMMGLAVLEDPDPFFCFV